MDERIGTTLNTVLVVDADVVIRTPLATYLRDCGLRVFEAETTDEARTVLEREAASIDVILCDAATVGSDAGLAFSRWVRANHPGLPVLLAGNVEKTADLAGDICEEGPSLAKPYDLSIVVDAVRQALASRDRGRPA
jgi:DNA-binding NtrC family response regulator